MKTAMYDIDLCTGVNCPKRNTCRRYLIWKNTQKPIMAWWVEPQSNNCTNYLLTKPKTN